MVIKLSIILLALNAFDPIAIAESAGSKPKNDCIHSATEVVSFSAGIRFPYARTNRTLQMLHRAGYHQLFPSLEMDLIPYLIDKQVLDVGTGTGGFVDDLIERGINVKAVDLTLTKKQIENANFYRADVLDLPFLDASFDVIVSHYSLFHFQAYDRFFIKAALAELSRTLKPGGKIFLLPSTHEMIKRVLPNVNNLVYSKLNTDNDSLLVVLEKK
ncbi:MAG: class I SAM-dependent methyltransferase [Bacteriovoracaceae bacterium]|nr:class I SAM-dependent methyltransferase [Bacteriovoracaceae bacterium]